MSKEQILSRIQPVPRRGQDRKRRILFYGDSPTCATGFGQVSKNILPYIYNTGRYEIDILGVNYWGDPHSFPFRIWPMAVNSNNDPYGRQRMYNHIMSPSVEFDILFFMQDTFILSNDLQKIISDAKEKKKFKSIYYFPIDGIPKRNWVEAMTVVDQPVTYSQFSFDQCSNLVPSIADRLKVIPHGADTKVFKPLTEESKFEFRSRYFGALADKFIITNVNRNQPRKDIPSTILAFREFRKHRPDSILYLHMAAKDHQGFNLVEIIQSLGLDITKDVILPSNFHPSTGYSMDVVNAIYNASDVVVSTALGEGWGLSWGEAMAAKTPVLFPSNTALSQYITEETGYPVRSGADVDHVRFIMNDNEVPRPTTDLNHFVERLIEIYDNREEAARRAENAYNLVQTKLIWDKHINPLWVNILDNLVADLDRETIAPVAPSTKPVLKGELL